MNAISYKWLKICVDVIDELARAWFNIPVSIPFALILGLVLCFFGIALLHLICYVNLQPKLRVWKAGLGGHLK